MALEADSDPVSFELEQPNLGALFWCFLKIGLTSFGGSSRAMMYAESVERRRWLRERDFLTGFAIAQVLPGANPVNLALYVGLRARGLIGAAAAVCGIVAPAFCVILLMGFVYHALSRYPATHFVLEGVAAAGVAATLAVGIKVALRMPRRLTPALIAILVFATVGVFHLPMIPVVVVAVPVSIAAAYWAAQGKANV
ncbi:MAG TPA: chromate transporter [Beijerinckiaceae bacterium]|nr:chromate transporter [Beijerinckiaceae bacterium]HVB89167.1 chromate transporter [Beijerinckiaceae bacterium]